jgi:hypothetical protein
MALCIRSIVQNLAVILIVLVTLAAEQAVVQDAPVAVRRQIVRVVVAVVAVAAIK